eukprot:scaffold14784_cov123-Isochrysis_galbana.AAC.2
MDAGGAATATTAVKASMIKRSAIIQAFSANRGSASVRSGLRRPSAATPHLASRWVERRWAAQ